VIALSLLERVDPRSLLAGVLVSLLILALGVIARLIRGGAR
jgi:hypothetical protein